MPLTGLFKLTVRNNGKKRLSINLTQTGSAGIKRKTPITINQGIRQESHTYFLTYILRSEQTNEKML
jgi:hypothetical protein